MNQQKFITRHSFKEQPEAEKLRRETAGRMLS